MPFSQPPPELTDTWLADAPLREHLERVLPADVLAAVTPELAAMGRRAATDLLALAAQAEAEPPELVGYDPWGRRVDRIHTSPAWAALHRAQVEAGLCALPYEASRPAGSGLGEHARSVQHALLHLYAPSSATYSCPVAMTDAAARVLTDYAEPALRDRVVERLVARDPVTAWTAGQWMTEREGGSDVARTATVARHASGSAWTLHGTKWFTSATTADCALAPARPDGAGPGSGPLALFLVEASVQGRRQLGDTILVNRLKDKLGTRSLPTAELTLDGARATLIGEPSGGVRRISGMLNVTRYHNAAAAAAGMRRAADLAIAYARVRHASGSRLVTLPLHAVTLADLSVDAEGAFALAARLAQLLGRVEAGAAEDGERRALRGLTPLAKLLTGKDAVAVASEALEAFGGAGYVEDTGLPALLRDAQVLPIWEGTTNVLALDLLRAAVRDGAVAALLDDTVTRLQSADIPELAAATRAVAATRDDLAAAATGWAGRSDAAVQAGMRRFAMRLGRTYAASLLCEHAAHRLAKAGDDRAALAARRYVRRWLGGETPDQLAEAERLLAASHAGG